MTTKRELSLTHYQYRDYVQAHCHGADNAQTAEAIALETGISPRKQQQLKADLLERGVVICTSCAEPMGTYWPADDAERAPYVRQLERRVSACAAALGIIYRNCPALRPVVLHSPPRQHRNRGAQVTAQQTLPV